MASVREHTENIDLFGNLLMPCFFSHKRARYTIETTERRNQEL